MNQQVRVDSFPNTGEITQVTGRSGHLISTEKIIATDFLGIFYTHEEVDSDFEYEGEMNADVALDADHCRIYPFARLTGPANVLIMPAIHSASIATKLLGAAGGATVLGPMLLGLEKPVQIARLGASVSEILNLAVMAAHDLSVNAHKEAAE